MKKYKGFLIDLDGTMYRGNEPIESAIQFVNALAKRELPYVFVTNNSSQTPKQVAHSLGRFGITVHPEQIITSSVATANYVRQLQARANVYLIGEKGLRTAFREQGLSITTNNPDFVVIGIDRQITYEKLRTACLAVRGGAKFVATNGDKAIPTEVGLVPGNGALLSVISTSTGQEPTVIGKPERIIMQEALTELQLEAEETVMIGDNYATDITAGMNAQMDTILVLSGVTTRADLQTVRTQPTYIVDQLTEIIPLL